MTTRASSATLGDVRAISPASSFDSIHLPFWAKPLNQDRLKRDLRDIHTSLEITGVLLGRDIFDLEHQPLIDDFLKSLINDMVVVDHAACHEQLLRLGEEKLVTSWLGVTTHRIALQLNLDLAYGPFTEQAGSFQDWRANGLILGLELAMEERGMPEMTHTMKYPLLTGYRTATGSACSHCLSETPSHRGISGISEEEGRESRRYSFRPKAAQAAQYTSTAGTASIDSCCA